MSDKVVATAEARSLVGKKVKQLRKQGFVPAVMYGSNLEATPLMIQYQVAEKTWQLAGKHHPVELSVGSTKKLAMIKTADRDPVKRRLRHLSFQVVNRHDKVTTEVPVKVAGAGETVAEKAGLVVLSTIDTVEIEAVPDKLPDVLEVSGEKFVTAGDHATVADIIPVEGVTVLNDPEQVIATVYEPSALAAKNDAAGGDATEDTEVQAENGAEEPSEATATSAEKSEK